MPESLEMLRRELSEEETASPSFVQGIAQSLATHLVRTYRDDENPRPHRSTSLPAFQLHRVLKMDASLQLREFNAVRDSHDPSLSLDEGINVGKLAAAVKMSESHFSRSLQGNTGFSPSQYFIRLRMSKAQELLRETTKPIIEIGMSPTSSARKQGSVSTSIGRERCATCPRKILAGSRQAEQNHASGVALTEL